MFEPWFSSPTENSPVSIRGARRPRRRRDAPPDRSGERLGRVRRDVGHEVGSVGPEAVPLVRSRLDGQQGGVRDGVARVFVGYEPRLPEFVVVVAGVDCAERLRRRLVRRAVEVNVDVQVGKVRVRLVSAVFVVDAAEVSEPRPDTPLPTPRASASMERDISTRSIFCFSWAG